MFKMEADRLKKSTAAAAKTEVEVRDKSSSTQGKFADKGLRNLNSETRSEELAQTGVEKSFVKSEQKAEEKNQAYVEESKHDAEKWFAEMGQTSNDIFGSTAQQKQTVQGEYAQALSVQEKTTNAMVTQGGAQVQAMGDVAGAAEQTLDNAVYDGGQVIAAQQKSAENQANAFDAEAEKNALRLAAENGDIEAKIKLLKMEEDQMNIAGGAAAGQAANGAATELGNFEAQQAQTQQQTYGEFNERNKALSAEGSNDAMSALGNALRLATSAGDELSHTQQTNTNFEQDNSTLLVGNAAAAAGATLGHMSDTERGLAAEQDSLDARNKYELGQEGKVIGGELQAGEEAFSAASSGAASGAAANGNKQINRAQTEA